MNVHSALIIFVLFLFPSVSLCAPSITGVSGTVSDGSSITVAGSGFGNSGPTIKVFDNFEGGTTDANIGDGVTTATIGEWIDCGAACEPSYYSTYSTNYAKSGTKSSRQNWTTDLQEGARWMGLQWESAVTEIYFSFWTYLPTGMSVPDYAAGANWKVWWLNPIWYGHDDPRNFDSDYSSEIITEPPTQTSLCWVDDADGQDRACYNHPNGYFDYSMTKGVWHRFEVYLLGSSTSNGVAQIWLTNGSSARTLYANLTDRTTLNTANGIMGWIEMHFPGFARADTTTNTYYDDIYVATGTGARARVEIGDADTYAECTDLAVATPTSWGDTSVTATVRQGSFDAEDSAYLYVVHADGSVNATGHPVTIGAGSHAGMGGRLSGSLSGGGVMR